jgi:hypothetical protein
MIGRWRRPTQARRLVTVALTVFDRPDVVTLANKIGVRER